MAIVIIIIMGVLLAVETALIFWLFWVLKNTFSMTDGLMDMIEGKMPSNLKKAYNDKYYPAIVIAKVIFDCKDEGKIVDFSMYEKYKIVGFTIMTTDSMEKFYGVAAQDEEMLEEINKPVIIKNALVYEVSEGVWMWKSE